MGEPDSGPLHLLHVFRNPAVAEVGIVIEEVDGRQSIEHGNQINVLLSARRPRFPGRQIHNISSGKIEKHHVVQTEYQIMLRVSGLHPEAARALAQAFLDQSRRESHQFGIEVNRAAAFLVHLQCFLMVHLDPSLRENIEGALMNLLYLVFAYYLKRFEPSQKTSQGHVFLPSPCHFRRLGKALFKQRAISLPVPPRPAQWDRIRRHRCFRRTHPLPPPLRPSPSLFPAFLLSSELR
ncbi:hypothetical protein ES708_15123 [subsurface metagenome]